MVWTPACRSVFSTQAGHCAVVAFCSIDHAALVIAVCRPCSVVNKIQSASRCCGTHRENIIYLTLSFLKWLGILKKIYNPSVETSTNFSGYFSSTISVGLFFRDSRIAFDSLYSRASANSEIITVTLFSTANFFIFQTWSVI
jgi:hypothetical protein